MLAGPKKNEMKTTFCECKISGKYPICLSHPFEFTQFYAERQSFKI